MSNTAGDGLNQAQRDAVANLSGPLLVLAGAGTGKTRVITFRIANLIRHGTRPERILAMTFTNKAAREMRDRALKMLGGGVENPPLITTFHSFGMRLLRVEADKLGYDKDFLIYDRGDAESVARTVLRELKVPADLIRPGDLLARVSDWKSAGRLSADRADGVVTSRDQILARAFQKYQDALRAAGAMDFDDLLALPEQLLREDAEAHARWAGRFDHVLVDEYQDTNATQFRLLKLLTSTDRSLLPAGDAPRSVCVVGDDDQSIYGWRGADVRNILDFDRAFAGATVVRLEENYRCCPNILQMANNLIRFNPDRHDKTLRPTRLAQDAPRFIKFDDELAEAAGVVRDILQARATGHLPWSAFAILFRTNEQPRLFEQECRARGVPYVLVGGHSFFDRKEIRDALAYLKAIAFPADEVSLTRVLNVPARGVGESIVSKLVEFATKAGLPTGTALPEYLANPAHRAPEGLRAFAKTIADFRTRLMRPKVADLAGAVRDLLAELDYPSEIRHTHPKDPEEQRKRWDSVGELLNMLRQYEERAESPSLVDFLQQIALDQKEERDDKPRDQVTLMTLHSAKGLEFPHVYLVGMEKGLLPHARSQTEEGLAEERRLAYVGVTRAKDRLTLTRAESRARHGVRFQSEASVFLPEMFGHIQPGAAPAAPPERPRRGFHNHRWGQRRD